ncbi:uncharacterized protein [Musca autumnalis]|uniref:uncharacterized protein n=1 Tax=Musca autumnalis TaxID=221902 RepID=UPI003CEC0CCE
MRSSSLSSYSNNNTSGATAAAAGAGTSSVTATTSPSLSSNTNSTIVNNLALKLNEQCNISKLSTASQATTTTNFNLNEFNAMKNHNVAIMAQQQQLVGPQLGLMQQPQQQQQQNNDNSINNLLLSNNANNHVTTTLNMNSKIWSSQQQQQQQQQQLQQLHQQNLYQSSSNNFPLDSMANTNHCSEAMISSLWGSESSSSGCSSGSGSQPSLSPTLLNSAPNYRSNSKESLWSQQTSPSTSSSGCGNQLRDTYYTGSSKLSTTNTSPTSWSMTNQQQQPQQQQAHLLYDTNEMSFSKMNNIWEIPQQNTTNGSATATFNHHDLFPELWSNLNATATGQLHSTNTTSTTDNISDISSNTSSSNNDCGDIWRSNSNATTAATLMQPNASKAMLGTANPATNLNMNENNTSGLGAAACMQLFSDEFLFM